ncbi:hypothetical protein VCUG_01461 [Vavraia culicis subsp. floridensis]|uniref:Uncharacterized protein n=1 Tax=Vavraia culicis (isolate floridensis) TaxID=948595 RepID=L2GTM5_VAVCU|nr:uncharacterized protein VCUG_01461 [Vavraia culicis subsp. floridensis]ELA47016.1 hypothetical protein VCUG_01461 [Vavraia culicis subsp. floridensis]
MIVQLSEDSYYTRILKNTLALYIFYYNTFLAFVILIQPQLESHNPFLITRMVEYVIKNYGFVVTVFVRMLSSYSSGLSYKICIVLVDFAIYFLNTCQYGLCNLCDKIFSTELKFNTSGHIFILSYFSYLVYLAFTMNPKKNIFVMNLIVWIIYMIYAVNTITFYHTKEECFASVVLATISSYAHLAIILTLNLA